MSFRPGPDNAQRRQFLVPGGWTTDGRRLVLSKVGMGPAELEVLGWSANPLQQGARVRVTPVATGQTVMGKRARAKRKLQAPRRIVALSTMAAKQARELL